MQLMTEANWNILRLATTFCEMFLNLSSGWPVQVQVQVLWLDCVDVLLMFGFSLRS
jgi:hypothetical protein